jgi:hypothetical protein
MGDRKTFERPCIRLTTKAMGSDQNHISLTGHYFLPGDIKHVIKSAQKPSARKTLLLLQEM